MKNWTYSQEGYDWNSELPSLVQMINQLTSRYRLILGGKKKKRKREAKTLETNVGKTKIWNMQINGTIKGSRKNGKREKSKGKGNERWREKVWKASSNVSIRGRITVIPGSTWSIWISKSSVIKCSFRVAVRFYEWASLVNRPRRRWPERRPRFI